MFLDELPNEFSAGSIDEAVHRAAEAEASSPADLREFGKQLIAQNEQELPNEVAQLLTAEGLICQLMIANEGQAARYGAALAPIWEMDGKVFPPHVHMYPDALRPYLERRADSATRRDAESRYRDFIWQRWRDGRQGSGAIAPYLAIVESADLGDIHQAEMASDSLLRALDLGTKLRQHMEETRAALDIAMRRFLEHGLTLPLLEAARAGARLLSLDPDATRQLRAHLSGNVDSMPDMLGKQQILQSSLILARTLGDTDAAIQHLRDEAAICEEEAAKHNGLVRQHWLREAIRLFHEAGDSDAQARLRSAYLDAGVQINEGDLTTVTGTITISLDEMREGADQLTVGKEVSLLGFVRLPYEIGLWQPWESVRADREAEEGKSISALLSHTQIMADGRLQPEPDRDTHPEDFARARDISWVSRRAVMTAGLAELLIDELRKRGAWTAPNLTAVMAAINEDLAQSCSEGFVRYEADDPWSALHVLAPQVEHLARILGIEADARVTSYTPHEGMRWVSMSGLLKAPEVRAALGEDLALNIEAIFIEAYGQNIRNNVAHGAFSYPGNAKNVATLCIMSLLSLGAVVLRERARKGGSTVP